MSLWGSIKRGATAVATGGLSEVPGAKGIISGLPGTIKDSVVAPNSYDATGNLDDSKKRAAAVYDLGLQGAGNSHQQSAKITAQQLATPTAITAQTVTAPAAVTARDVGTSGLVSGPQADALRQQTIDQAVNAAASPSSAAAQMRAAGAQISQQQLGQAAMARGGDRAGMRRAAMLATGQQGLQAAGTTAALAAQETAQKQAALTSALQGVRAGDVSIADASLRPAQLNQAADIATGNINAGNQLAAATANQGAGLTAAIQTGQQGLVAGQANQGADLTAQQATIKNVQDAWTQEQAAKQGWANTSLQAVGAQNQAQGVAAGYGAKQNETRQQTAGGLMNAAGSMIGLSDEAAKTDISTIGDDGLDNLMGSTHGTSSYDDLANEFGTPQTGPTIRDRLQAGFSALGSSLRGESPSEINPPTFGQNFLNWQMPQIGSSKPSNGAGLSKLVSAAGPLLAATSDERAKRDVERMDDAEIADWAEAVPTAAFRYRSWVPGTDGGEEYHAGTLAGELQRTGPLGKLMVHRREDGLKEVEYGPLGLMVGKGAMSRANEALDWAKAAYAMAAGKGLVHG